MTSPQDVVFLLDVDNTLLSAFLIDYPFADRLYPRALEIIERLKR